MKIEYVILAVMVYFVVRYFLEKKKRLEVEQDLAVLKAKDSYDDASKALDAISVPEYPIPPHMLDHIGGRPPVGDIPIGGAAARAGIAEEEESSDPRVGDTLINERTGERITLTNVEEVTEGGSEGGLRSPKGRVQ